MNIHQQSQLLQLSVSLNALQNARENIGSSFIDLSRLALYAEESGADQIGLYVSEQKWPDMEADVRQLSQQVINSFELEVLPTRFMLDQLAKVPVKNVCLVSAFEPFRTQIGAIDLLADLDHVQAAIKELHAQAKQVSIYILPVPEQIIAAANVGLSRLRLDCSSLAHATDGSERERELVKIRLAVTECVRYGISVTLGGALALPEITLLAGMPDITQVHVDGAVFAQSLLIGWEKAVREMTALLIKSRLSNGQM